MKRSIAVRVLGGLFIVIASLNLVGLTSPEVRVALISTAAVSIRYSLMLLAGIGLVLLTKWGAYTLLLSVIVNWVMFFAIYDGNSGTYPIWVSLVGPFLFAVILYWSWKDLR